LKPVGHLTYHGLLGAAAGFAVAVVMRTGKNVLAMRQKRKEDPLRCLTMMEKAVNRRGVPTPIGELNY